LTGRPPVEKTPRLKAIGWSIAFIVLTLVSSILIGVGFAFLLTGSWESAVQWLGGVGPGPILLQAAVTLASAALFTWLIGARVADMTLRDLRYQTKEPPRRGLGTGLVVGGLTATSALLISVTLGGAAWVSDAGGIGDYLLQAGKTVAVLAPAALTEEVIFRGVPMVLLASALGRGAAVVLTAVGFALAHVGNPNLTALGLGNIAMAGVFLGVCFYAPGGIWTAWGAHLGWNAVLACLDTPVSGVPFRIPFLDYHAGSPAWLTGGSFGPEGGLAATIALTAAILVAVSWAGKDEA
jgi:hypothetical protein